jgi:outer membrane protein assembly factor BamD (BamD/ComL family)
MNNPNSRVAIVDDILSAKKRNRSKFIIEKYPNTPSVPAALHLMARNYDSLGMDKLAKDARRVLKKSYPIYEPHYTLIKKKTNPIISNGLRPNWSDK